MTTPARLWEALQSAPRLAGRRQLVRLVNLLRIGCRSPLELWGYEQVFGGPEFASLRWQVPVRLGDRTVYLDALDPTSGVNLELDGAKYHASPADRERDLRRDAALVALGLIVVRLTHHHLNFEVEWSRRAALSAMTAHRRRNWTLPDAIMLR
jgi:very-short-patch-repair endonuclease